MLSILSTLSSSTAFAFLAYATSTAAERSIAQHLIDITDADVFHLDLHSRGVRVGYNAGEQESVGVPWFSGFNGARFNEGVGAAAATVSHPIRRILSYLREEGVELEQALAWTKGQGIPADSRSSYRQGYQLIDNYLVRVLAGRSAWDLPPGGVGKRELQAARRLLGKFEVLLREDCLSTDLPLLGPYIGRIISANEATAMTSEFEGFNETGGSALASGMAGQMLVRANRWDLQLWDFGNRLVLSRSTTLDSYLCGYPDSAKAKKTPGDGRRAVVYNSPDFHATSLSMFSCVLMSWGFNVTVVIEMPASIFAQLLPCPHRVVSIYNATIPGAPGHILNSTVSEALGLPPWTPAVHHRQMKEQTAENNVVLKEGKGGRERKLVSLDVSRRNRGELVEMDGLFDISVLCTVYTDLQKLFADGKDTRLVDALLWNAKASIWNVHAVTRALANKTVPIAAHDFAEGAPSTDGRRPPPTFLTLFGAHVETWEGWLEEAYEGWGWDKVTEDGASPQHDERQTWGKSNLGGLFRSPGVVYPIHPTGHMKLPRPSAKISSRPDASGEGNIWPVKFVVQGKVESCRRDYGALFTCLEGMCNSGRSHFAIDVIGSNGELHEVLEDHPCTNSRYTEGRNLEYNEFYGRISLGDFVVTASTGHDYEYDRATSSVPTALLLERPLVMSSSLLDAYPCLRKSRVHRMVANDDMCLNLQAAYDLTPEEYDEMALEAQDCKLHMWQQSRETIAEMASGWVLD